MSWQPDDKLEEQEEVLRLLLEEARNMNAAGEALQAEEQYKKALLVARQMFGQDSPHVAKVCLNIAAFYASQDKHYSARAFSEEVRRILGW